MCDVWYVLEISRYENVMLELYGRINVDKCFFVVVFCVIPDLGISQLYDSEKKKKGRSEKC